MSEAYIAILRAGARHKSAMGRGMDFRHGAIDWLGGYPYESATPEATTEMVGSGSPC